MALKASPEMAELAQKVLPETEVSVPMARFEAVVVNQVGRSAVSAVAEAFVARSALEEACLADSGVAGECFVPRKEAGTRSVGLVAGKASAPRAFVQALKVGPVFVPAGYCSVARPRSAESQQEG